MDLYGTVNCVMAVQSSFLKPDSGSEILVCGMIIVQVCDSYLICLRTQTVNASRDTSSQSPRCLVRQCDASAECFLGCCYSKMNV